MDEDLSLAERALGRMRSDILALRLAPGEVISERSLEAFYGVSRTPIRQALAELIREGLVVRAERGYAVAPFDLAQLEQIFEYREVVEVAAIRLAAARATPVEVDRLQEAVDRSLGDATPESWFTAGLDVHVWLAELSHNRFLRDAVQDCVNRTIRARWLVASSPQARAAAHREHNAIIALLRRGDGEAAAEAVLRHTRDVRAQVMQALEQSRRLFGARGFAEPANEGG
ncbi:GntR family transcriptional regulator [Nitratireductor sp. ZSWI3]|uniref:GntR family transcriptional regulator n=1 Tax=Nitratireductor sp. ZSWI3 TaxID=2966359 RepID=UPI0021506208|nr:GntR family transcriptional regulator [Nitratireductor sp. ZSWI3]MCR4269014.1 GntR family transcriptional regulator [Nitratireductor sp. ZSWI3]